MPPPAVDRAELLQALEAARSAYAAGTSDLQPNLAGRRFSVRESFGCGGTPAPQDEDGVARWGWGPENKTIEIRLAPADLTSSLAAGAEAARWEAAEGFWLTRPWLKTDDCPAAPAREPAAQQSTVPSPPPRRTDGLAAVFEREGSRVGRRGDRAFSFTLRDEAPLLPPTEGYRLVVEGRFSAFETGRAIRCHAASPDLRPICIAAADVDRVAIETADGRLLKEWRQG